MPAILVFLLGTGTGVALKYLWDKYKNLEDAQDDETKSIPIIPLGNGYDTDTETPISADKFYLSAISSLFSRYNVKMSEMDDFGVLCNKIERGVKIDLLELLTKQTSVQSLLQTYQTESIKPFQVSFNFADSGASVSGNILSDSIKNLGLTINTNSNSEQKVELILKAHYAKGIGEILDNFGKEFEKLELLNKNNDPSLENYYNNLKDDLEFHLRLLKK